jgi:hypothetical protein
MSAGKSPFQARLTLIRLMIIFQSTCTPGDPAIEILACPNCGAPLRPTNDQTLVICLYCGSSSRLNQPLDSPLQVSKEAELTEEELDEVRKLLAAGKREQAVQRYREATPVSGPEAEQAINGLSKQLAAQTILRQQLGPLGYVLILFFAVLFIVSIWAILSRAIPTWLGILLVILSASQLYPFLGAIRTELRLRHAKEAPAVILKYLQTGQFRQAYTFRAWVEVRPADEAPFQAEMDLVVRKKRLADLHENSLISILYQPGDPPLVVYNGAPKKPGVSQTDQIG